MFRCPECDLQIGVGTGTDGAKHLYACLHTPAPSLEAAERAAKTLGGEWGRKVLALVDAIRSED